LNNPSKRDDHTVKGLAIKDVAEQTGLAAGTIRMWEQRYGFPEPARTASGYRVYSEEDVESLRRVLAYRETGLSVPAALERARAAADGPTDRPSIYGAIAPSEKPGRPLVLSKRTLLAISRGIEDETLARAAAPVVVGSFQHDRHYRAVEHRYRRLANVADLCVAFADFPAVAGGDGEPYELPITADDALGNEWAVIVDAPGYAACLLAWETPESQRDDHLPEGRRRFEALWTLDPQTVRRAALVGAALAVRSAPEVGERMQRLLDDRPLALESPAPALTALTNRIVSYMDADRD
jgi:DICT domain-containing protein